MTVKNSQVAVICAAILAGALINAVRNFVLVRSLRSEAVGRAGHPRSAQGGSAADVDARETARIRDAARSIPADVDASP